MAKAVVIEIGKCSNCAKHILDRGAGWVHVATKMVHCSDSLRSTHATPVTPNG